MSPARIASRSEATSGRATVLPFASRYRKFMRRPMREHAIYRDLTFPTAPSEDRPSRTPAEGGDDAGSRTWIHEPPRLPRNRRRGARRGGSPSDFPSFRHSVLPSFRPPFRPSARPPSVVAGGALRPVHPLG